MKRIALLLLMLVLCLAPVSCSSSERELKAEILNDDLAAVCLNNSILNEYRTYDSSNAYGCVVYPDPFAIIIETEDEFDSLFTSVPEEISADLSKETLIIFAFTTEYRREIVIEGISEENGSLTVEYKMKSPSGFFGVGDAAIPFERFVALKVNSKNIESAEFVEVE